MRKSSFSLLIFLLTGLVSLSPILSVQAGDSLGTWTAKNYSSTYNIQGMAYGNNTYVIVGQNTTAPAKGFIATSTDAKDPTKWTIRSTGSTTEQFNSVIFSKGRFIAVCKQPSIGNVRIWTSDTNGASWVARDSDKTTPGLVAGGLHSIATDGNGKLVAAGGVANQTNYGWITVSEDNGTSWNVVMSTAVYEWWVSGKVYGVGYAVGKWYVLTESSTYRSTNAGLSNTDWSSVAGIGGVNSSALGPKVASNGTSVVIATTSGPKFSGDGGTTWKSCYKAKPYSALTLTSNDSSVVFAEGTYVLSTRSDGNIWVSENGLLWKRWQLPSSTNTNSLCFAKRAFWCTGESGTLSKSPTWFKARNGCSSDYPYTVFDAEDGPPNRIGLPQYRVNTASLNLILESTLFYTKALCAPINFKLVYNSKPCADNTTADIGPFGKNWRFRYESAIGRFGEEAQVINGGGRNFIFTTPNGENIDSDGTPDVKITLNPPDGIFDTLVYDGTASPKKFELTLKSSHLTYVYGTPGTGDGTGGSKNNIGLFYLSQIKDQFGRHTDIAVDSATGKISSITNAARTFNFYYMSFDGGASERCWKIEMPDGRTVGFNYDSSNNLTEITDMMGYHGTYVYDDYGFLASMSTAGKTNTFTYKDRPGYETDPIETRDRYIDSLSRPGGKKITYELQDEGETVKRTDSAGQVTLFKNKDGQTTAITDPLGKVRQITYNGAKLPEMVTDEKGGVFTYKYDSSGNMTEKKDANAKITTYTYDADNNLTSMTNAVGKTWNYDYNASFQPIKITSPAPLSHITSIGYFNNNIHDVTDARGYTTLFTFDNFGNLTSISAPSTTFTYDANGFRCVSITDANTKVKSISWDKNDRITKVTYDTAGGVSYSNEYSAFGQTGFTDELGHATSIVRDDLGFITSVTDPLGYTSLTEYDADNRPVKTTDPLGRSSTTTYDKDGHPLVFTDAKGFKITKAYDAIGNLISFKDKNNAETTYGYDANGRLLTTSDPLKKTTTLVRDELGRVSSNTNARGQAVTFTYDADGRLSGKTPAGSTAVSYTRDGNGNILTQTDAWGTTTFTYGANPLGKITKIVYPDLLEANLTWDNSGQLTSITYPGNLVVNYTYDDFNRIPVPSSLKYCSGTDLFGDSRTTNAVTGIEVRINGTKYDNASCTMSYNARGQITQIARYFTKTNYSYDRAGRLTQINHSSIATTDVDFTANYSYDAVGNVISETFSGSSYYQDATLPAKMANTYNLAGQITNRGGSVCVNDADGNMTDVGAGNFKCTYDSENRLTQTTRKMNPTPETINYTYNADGLRVKKEIVGGATTVYHYLPTGLLLFTSDGSGTIIDRHIYAGSALVATCKPANNFIHYYGDRQAHVRFIAADNQVLVKYDYLPYAQTGTLKTGVADALIDGNPFTYNGILGVQDEGNGIFYMQQRFYDSATGRFFQKDPLEFSAGSNLYAFAMNNPMIYADPTGKNPVLILGTLVLGVTAAVVAIKTLGEKTSEYIQSATADDKLTTEAWLNKQGRENNEKKAEEMAKLAKQGAQTALQVEAFRFSPTSSNLGEVAVDQARGTAIDYGTSPQGDKTASATNELPPPPPQQTEGGE